MFTKLKDKSFIKIALVGAGNFINAILGFLFLSAVAKSLSISDFGRYALLVALLIGLSKMLDFGTNSLFVAQYIATKEPNLNDRFISSKFAQFLISIPISLGILFLLGFNSMYIILIFLMGMFFYAINYTLFGFFQKNESYLKLIMLNLFPALIKGCFAFLIFLKVVNFGFSGYFTVFSLSLLSSALMLFFLPERLSSIKLDFSNFVKDIKKAFSPGTSQLITEGFPAVNNTLAKIFTDFSSVGIFSLADKISSIFVIISFTIFTVLLPKNAIRKKEEKGYDFVETFILALGIIVLAIFTLVAARFFIPWFFDDKYNASLPILNILVFAGAISSIHTFLENFFFVEGKTKFLAVFSTTKLVLLVSLGVYLIPVLGLKGLAWAQVTASGLTLAILIYSIKRIRDAQEMSTQEKNL